MRATLADLVETITSPVRRVDKFLWREMIGDSAQIYGKSLDVKAQITEVRPADYRLTMIFRNGERRVIPNNRSIKYSKARAEAEYSTWIRNQALIE